MEQQCMIVVSDLWLDKPKVLEKFRKMCEVLEEDPPALLVLAGNFQSVPIGQAGSDQVAYQGLMDELANLLLRFERMCQKTHFVIVPGPLDPPNQILPRRELPKTLARSLLRLPHVTLTTSPCRIQFLGRQITFFREDIMGKMRSNCIVPSHPEESITNQLIVTLLDQAHLSPLPASVCPVFWNYEYSLHLNPLPDVLIVADRCEQFDVQHKGCLCLNPGMFSMDQAFLRYSPVTNQPEFVRLSDD
eukprot:TRINITY_DN3013_c0_g1_i1.p2 TRINITY_DN3013_c0_g1~~TRINITY_DN3013_c0_g1_i1.p2  ORF type:complete len:246 (+),score=61.95 TRINITY_DN3013_c0_g1_i1:137-874(+)